MDLAFSKFICFMYFIGIRIICSLSRLLQLARRKCASDGCNSQYNIIKYDST